MSEALDSWRRKLEHLQHQEAILSDPAQKFTVAEQIKEARSRIAELEATNPPSSRQTSAQPRPPIAIAKLAVVFLLVIGLLTTGGVALFRYVRHDPVSTGPTSKTVVAAAGFAIFEKPQQDALIVVNVRSGERFDLVSGKGTRNWAFVRYRDKEGWVMAQDMSVVTPIEVARGFGFRGAYWQIFFTSPQPVTGPSNKYGIEARFALAARRCKTSLDVAIYELNNRDVTDAILDAHTRGVKVRIVTGDEGFGFTGSTLAELKQSGIPVVSKRKGSRLMHSKFAIMDQATVWTGSWNYTDTGTFQNNENVIAIDSPEIAAVFGRKFQKLFNDGPERTEHVSEAKAQESSPLPHGVRVLFAPEDRALDTLATAVGSAKKSIQFMTFALGDRDLSEILRTQAAKGVSVRGIVEKSLSRLTAVKSLLGAAVPNLEIRLDGNKRNLRHNCVVIDDRVVWLGSMNISRASTRNDENLISVPDAALASMFHEEFERLWLMSHVPSNGTDSGVSSLKQETTDSSGTTATSGEAVTDSVASDVSTSARRDQPPPQGSIRIASARGQSQGDLVHALNSSISAARRERSAIIGRLDRNCRPDHAFPSVTACDDTLDLTIRDLRTGQTDGATLTGEGVGSTAGAAAQDARSKLIAKIREHFSGEDRP